jgi:uncharacterized membrane protein
VKRREDLTSPRSRRKIGVQYDSDVFGAFSESIANFLGTARFLVFQTIVIAVWIIHNIAAPDRFVFDSWARGFVLLTLLLSVQASYAAPLILLAQSRQERRDRITSENDREVAERTQSDTEFLAREIASVRVTMSDMVTGEDFGDRLDQLNEMIEGLSRQVDQLSVTSPDVAGEPSGDTSDSSSMVADEN